MGQDDNTIHDNLMQNLHSVLSEPCVYISCDYGNVKGPHRADDFGMGVPSPVVHSPGTGLVQPVP